MIEKLFDALPKIHAAVKQHHSSPLNRLTLGMLLRDINTQWNTAVKLSLAVDLVDSLDPSDVDVLVEQAQVPDAAATFIEQYKSLLAQVIAYDLSECHNLKPICDGKEIMAILNTKGRIVGEVLDDVMRWQLEHSNGTKEECAEFVKKKWMPKVAA